MENDIGKTLGSITRTALSAVAGGLIANAATKNNVLVDDSVILTLASQVADLGAGAVETITGTLLFGVVQFWSLIEKKTR